MSPLENFPLSNHLLYDGQDVDDAREVLSRLFTEISIEPSDTRKPFRSLVYGVELPRISVCYLRFEGGATAGPVQPMDFHTLQLNPTGTVTYDTDDGVVAGSASRGVMLSAGQTVRNHHSAANGNLALIVKDDVLRDYQSMWTGKTQSQSLKFQLDFDPEVPRISSFLGFVDQFVQNLNRPGGILEIPAAVASFENALLTSMLFSFEHQFSEKLNSEKATASFRQVRNIEDYIESHANQPIDIVTLVTVSGLSAATIHRTFRKHREYTPMQFLKQTRMGLVNQRLLMASSSDSVTRIAMECGFTHLGRFASEYRYRFGEDPSQTLKRTTT
ncbi:MAG: AraC family transcriptional regulator [Gammaproteobacteria bacterium]|nr:AraC family transcriptional regulator [Gammaproteobacteria bacterium]